MPESFDTSAVQQMNKLTGPTAEMSAESRLLHSLPFDHACLRGCKLSPVQDKSHAYCLHDGRCRLRDVRSVYAVADSGVSFELTVWRQTSTDKPTGTLTMRPMPVWMNRPHANAVQRQDVLEQMRAVWLHTTPRASTDEVEVRTLSPLQAEHWAVLVSQAAP